MWRAVPLVKIIRLLGAVLANEGRESKRKQPEGPSKQDLAMIAKLEEMRQAALARKEAEGNGPGDPGGSQP